MTGFAATPRDLAAAGSSSLLDQVTKAIVRRDVAAARERRRSFPGLVDFTHVRNTGAAFGFLNAVDFPFKTVVIAVVATAALVGVGVVRAGLAHHQMLARVGLALIIGGAAGNLIDRVVAGSVVDFVDVYWRSVSFLGVQRRRFGDHRSASRS